MKIIVTALYKGDYGSFHVYEFAAVSNRQPTVRVLVPQSAERLGPPQYLNITIESVSMEGKRQ